MSYKITFDTLKYAKLLKKHGIAHAGVHARALANALAQNLYTQNEIDHMMDVALNRVEKSLESLSLSIQQLNTKIDHRDRHFDRMEQTLEKVQQEFHTERLGMEKRFLRYIVATIGILGSLTVIANAVTNFFPV